MVATALQSIPECHCPGTGAMASSTPPSPAAVATTRKEEQEHGGDSLVLFSSEDLGHVWQFCLWLEIWLLHTAEALGKLLLLSQIIFKKSA